MLLPLLALGSLPTLMPELPPLPRPSLIRWLLLRLQWKLRLLSLLTLPLRRRLLRRYRPPLKLRRLLKLRLPLLLKLSPRLKLWPLL